MTTSFKALAVAGALSLLPLSAQAFSTFTLDFESKPPFDSGTGQPVPFASDNTPANQFDIGAFTFGVSFTGNNFGPVIFDTTCPDSYGPDCNGDADLQPAGGQGTDGIRGNVLALQENTGEFTPPDDDRSGGSVTFTLLSGPSLIWTGISAVDDGKFTFSTNLDGDLGMLQLTSDGATGREEFTSSIITAGTTNDSFTITFSDSGGVDELTFSVIPLPAPFALLLAAMGGFGFLSWRRTRAAA